MIIYQINNITKTYKHGKVVANKDISFNIEEGEIFGLLGPNGAGKTTLVKQMVGLLKPDSGNIKFYDIEVSKDPQLLTYFIGHMTQRIGALGDLYAYEALEITGKLKGMTKKAAKKQAQELIDEFNIKDFKKRPLNKLSGGQNRLVNFCAAIIGNPRILILDEPTSDLDPVYRKQVWDKLLDLNRKEGLTIILVTHNIFEAEKVLERVGLINHGIIKAIGTIGELKSRISSRVRVEIKLNPTENELSSDIVTSSQFSLINRGERQWAIYVSEERINEVVSFVTKNIGMHRLNDFRIMTSNLEDVYLQLSGGDHLNETA